MNEDIAPLSEKDANKIIRVINSAAEMYKNSIPADLYSEPYMSLAELKAEMQKMKFFGYFDETLVGVIGLQELNDVTLIRHLYVQPAYQRQGIGSELLDQARSQATGDDILVGTWQAPTWAIRFCEKHGFDLVENSKELLRKYWDVPQRQMEESVVLRLTE